MNILNNKKDDKVKGKNLVFVNRCNTWNFRSELNVNSKEQLYYNVREFCATQTCLNVDLTKHSLSKKILSL